MSIVWLAGDVSPRDAGGHVVRRLRAVQWSPDEPSVDCSARFVPFVTAGIPCDATGDATIDHNDLAAIAAAIGYSVFPGDPRDVDHDGTVTGRDVSTCAMQQTR